MLTAPMCSPCVGPGTLQAPSSVPLDGRRQGDMNPYARGYAGYLNFKFRRALPDERFGVGLDTATLARRAVRA